MPVILEHLAWPEISALREKNGGLLLLPLGATEQHGPHLPVAMDTFWRNPFATRSPDKTGVPVLSALRYTVSQGHTSKWPGTFSLRHETFISTLRDIAAWAVATGWRRLLFVNAHFGNDAPARVAVDQLRLAHLGKLQVGLVHAFKLDEAIWRSYTRDADDLHANAAETALMLHLHPELVHIDRLRYRRPGPHGWHRVFLSGGTNESQRRDWKSIAGHGAAGRGPVRGDGDRACCNQVDRRHDRRTAAAPWEWRT